jgi:hypothetical protein
MVTKGERGKRKKSRRWMETLMRFGGVGAKKKGADAGQKKGAAGKGGGDVSALKLPPKVEDRIAQVGRPNHRYDLAWI